MKHFILLVVAFLSGLAAHGQAVSQDNTNTEGSQPDPEARRDQAIKKLVAGSDLIVLGRVTRSYDGTARDGGMSYDVKIDSVLYGKDVPRDALRFTSSAWVQYAKYAKDERVLLFLKLWQQKLVQLQPVSYLGEKKQPPNAIILSPFKDCLSVIKAEIQKKRSSAGERESLLLAQGIKKLLPEGWQQTTSGVDSAPRRWSGATTAVTVSFKHSSLKFLGDGTSAACFQVWRTPKDYSGKLLPSQTEQPGGAWLLGASSSHRWFVEGLLPEDNYWQPIRAGLLRQFEIVPPK